MVTRENLYGSVMKACHGNYVLLWTKAAEYVAEQC